MACDDGKTALLVDPGDASTAAIKAAHARDLDIEAILLTHAHVDHVEGLAEAKEATGAPIYMHPLDRPILDAAGELAQMWGLTIREPPPPDHDLVADSDIEFGGSRFKVVHAPGHAPGHVIFVSQSTPEAIVGDVIFRDGMGRTDLPGGDLGVLLATIRQKVLTLPDETRLFPGHGPTTTPGRERRWLVPDAAGASRVGQ